MKQLNLGLKEAVEGVLSFIVITLLVSALFPDQHLYFQILVLAIAIIGIFTMPSESLFYMIGWSAGMYLMWQGGLLDFVDIITIIASWGLWIYINIVQE
ncbi:MAG: hypothetical protein NT051_06560 [Candidatus Micrarchaeota archaeon]|nr:hypothetical protein [Candidatus Micrarchaeota archaeon]